MKQANEKKFEGIEPDIFMDFLKNDDRNCRSNNMKKFFLHKKNYRFCNVINFEDQLWFVSLGWDTDLKGFAGVKVREVACQGIKAQTGYPSWQKPEKWENVTEEFWTKYMTDGIIAFPEIWRIKIPKQVKHFEAHAL